jgi:nitrate reductase NapD
MTDREDLHISGLVVHSMPARLQGVCATISAMPGACVHGETAAGKVVVTLEASSADDMVAQVNRIQQTDGVLSAALVYQCVDTLEAMNEVIDDGDDPT